MYNHILSWPSIDSKSLGRHGVLCLDVQKKKKKTGDTELGTWKIVETNKLFWIP